MDDSIRQLCERIASGDAEAFSRFYREWFDDLLAQARRATRRDESFCLDVVQEAMMRVIRSMPVLDSPAALDRWLGAVVRSCAYDRLRREIRRAARETVVAAQSAPGAAPRTEGEPPSHTEGDASRRHEAAEQLAWLRGELASLEPDLQSLIHWRYRLGWTLERIGAAVGLKPGAVDGRLRRAASRLRARHQERFDE